VSRERPWPRGVPGGQRKDSVHAALAEQCVGIPSAHRSRHLLPGIGADRPGAGGSPGVPPGLDGRRRSSVPLSRQRTAGPTRGVGRTPDGSDPAPRTVARPGRPCYGWLRRPSLPGAATAQGPVVARASRPGWTAGASRLCPFPGQRSPPPPRLFRHSGSSWPHSLPTSGNGFELRPILSSGTTF
jgi:hypothetical protein